ncbi:MAG: NUDIX hydrolase [Pseudomonadota bacterium]
MSDDSQRRVAFSGRIVRVLLEDIDMPDGERVPYEIVEHPGGAGVVALDTSDQVCLVRQYRPLANDWLWELPAGKLEHGDPLSTARAELAEEAGLTAKRWESLGVVRSSPGVFTEQVHLYLARDLAAVPRAPEPGEVMEVHWMALETAVARALSGEISDAKTIIGLLRAQAHERLG